MITRHVFVKRGCPPLQQSQNMVKTLSPTFWPPNPPPPNTTTTPRGIWCLWNFNYRTLFVSKTELLTDRRTDRILPFWYFYAPSLKGPTIWLLVASGGHFRLGPWGHKNTKMAALQGMHVLPKNMACGCKESVTTWQTDILVFENVTKIWHNCPFTYIQLCSVHWNLTKSTYTNL